MIKNTKQIVGLSDDKVLMSRRTYGNNSLMENKKSTFFSLVIESLGDPIIKILLIALGIKIIFIFNDSNVYETIGILIAIIISSLVSSLSEYGSEKAFEKLNESNSDIFCKVLRNNRKKMIGIDEIVVGDIIILETGDKVPADGKIIYGKIVLDESSLTGESKEIYKKIDDRILRGSVVIDKYCYMEVLAVGINTFYGKISTLVQEKSIESPLKLRLRQLAKIISKIGYICAFIIFISYLFNTIIVNNGFEWNSIIHYKNIFSQVLYALTLSVSVVVMAVPEGLPMMITLVLSSNMKRLLKSNVLVKKLVGIETAGSMNILFTDKTGTLTEGKMKMNMFIDTNNYEYNSIIKLKENCNYEILYQALIYNNSSFYSNNNIEGGNPTDRAIVDFFKCDDKSTYKILNEKRFNSVEKYSSITTNYNKATTFFKGSFELIINKSSDILINNSIRKIDKEKELLKAIEYTKKGYRVLAIAMSENPDIKNLTYLGIIILHDKIREGSYEGIKQIKDAGVNIVMLTGDSKETAICVAKELCITRDTSDVIISSEKFNKMTDNEVGKIITNLKIIYRCLPHDKNRLVKISQENNLIVGMTGDGVNDAPALKKADVGFSMGSGTEVAKETSDIVIMDDNISSIATSILYGRTIFKSIRKFVIFQLSVNFCALVLSIIGPFIGIMSPVTVIQMLWINIVMDTLAGLAFAYEPALKEYMEEPPKRKEEKIINRYMFNQIICTGLYSSIISIWFLKSDYIANLFRNGNNNQYVLTAFFGLFIFFAIFNLFNVRTHRINILSSIIKIIPFLIIISFIAIVQIILIYYGGELFRTTGLTALEFEIMIILAFSIIPFDFVRKILYKKSKCERGV